MTGSLLAQSLGAFIAGLLSSLSPCVYPMIPISIGFLGSSTHGRRPAVLLFFFGQVLTFTLLGVLAVKLGEVFGFSNELKWVNVAMGLALIAFGVSSYFSYLPSFLHRWNHVSRKLHTRELDTFVVPFIVGACSALLASPCTGPILGSVLMTLSQTATFERGLILMLCYSVGVSVLFLALGFGLLALEHLPRAGRWMSYVHTFSSLMMILAGGYFIIHVFIV